MANMNQAANHLNISIGPRFNGNVLYTSQRQPNATYVRHHQPTPSYPIPAYPLTASAYQKLHTRPSLEPSAQNLREPGHDHRNFVSSRTEPSLWSDCATYRDSGSEGASTAASPQLCDMDVPVPTINHTSTPNATFTREKCVPSARTYSQSRPDPRIDLGRTPGPSFVSTVSRLGLPLGSADRDSFERLTTRHTRGYRDITGANIFKPSTYYERSDAAFYELWHLVNYANNRRLSQAEARKLRNLYLRFHAKIRHHELVQNALDQAIR